MPHKLEDGRELWSVTLKDLDGTVEAVGPMFEASWNFLSPLEEPTRLRWLTKLKGSGVLLLVHLRLNDGISIWEPGFKHERKEPLQKVNSALDGKPLAELWKLDDLDRLVGMDWLIAVERKGWGTRCCRLRLRDEGEVLFDGRSPTKSPVDRG